MTPSARRSTALRTALVAVVFVVATLAMVRPTSQQMRTTMPQNLGDSVLITWVMHWGWHALLHDPLHYFSGNVFWPARDTLAYSDLLAPFIPVYGVFFALTGSWPLATNLTVLAMLGLCLTATYLLARRLLRRTDAAVLVALGYTFTGFNLSEWGHLQLQTLGLLPLAAWFFVRFADERRWGDAVGLGVATAATMLASVYFGLAWFVAFAVIAVGYLVATRFRPGPRFVAGMAVAGVVAVILMGPALLKYAAHAEAGRRGLEPERGLKARDLVTPAYNSYLWKGLATFEGHPELQEHGFYPGVTVALLAVGGAVVVARPRRTARATAVERDAEADAASSGSTVGRGTARMHLALLTAAGVAGLVLSLGPTVLGHPAPFRFFHDHIPGFGGIRVTARFGVLFLLALVLFAGAGASWLLERSKRLAPVVAALLAIAICADLAAPLTGTTLPTDAATLGVYRRVASLPKAAVVEVPMVDPSILPADWAYVEAPRMVYGTIGWRPRVNGYSATTPDSYPGDINTFNAFPSPEAIDRAFVLRVRYVILHVGAATTFAAFSEADAQTRITALPPTAHAERVGNAWLVDLGPTRPPDR